MEKQGSGSRSTIRTVLLLALLALCVAAYFAYTQNERANRSYSPTTTSFPTNSNPTPTALDNTRAAAGQAVVDELNKIPEGGTLTYKIPAGHYRVRVTANPDGIKAKWVGVACNASSTEEHVYETTCDPAADVQLVISNPTTLGLGPDVQATVSIVTR